MDKMTVNEKEVKRQLWKQKLTGMERLTEQERNVLHLAGLKYEGNVSFLYTLNECLVEGCKFIEDEEHDIQYERDRENHFLISDRQEIQFTYQEIRELVASMIDIFEEVFPLGSLVVLKKEHMDKVPNIREVEEVRIVVTHRYLFQENSRYYFPYAGVVYPTGMLGRKEVLNFTSALVEKVLHKGYRDEQEDAYHYLMKHELIIERGMHSFAFADKKTLDAYSAELKRQGE